MANSKLILDRSDPGVNELVGSWEDGQEYTVELRIRQESTSANTGDYTVLSVVAEEAPEAPAEKPRKSPPKPTAAPEY